MQPSILTPESLAEKTSSISGAIANLKGQVERAVITNVETYAQAGDLYKVIGNQEKNAEDARKKLVGPLNDHVKWINAQFKEKTEPLAEVKTMLKGKMDKFAEEEEERQREEAEAARKKAEEEALTAAANAEKAGNTELADATLEAAADLPTAVPKTAVARGNFAGASQRIDWKGEIVDIVEFCRAVGAGEIKKEQAEEAITVSQSWLNKLATTRKEALEKEKLTEKTNLGIRIYRKVSASVR